MAVMWVVIVLTVVLIAEVDVRRLRRAFGSEDQLPDEQRLLRRLFKLYSSDVRPVYNSSHNVKVIFNFNLIQIMDMGQGQGQMFNVYVQSQAVIADASHGRSLWLYPYTAFVTGGSRRGMHGHTNGNNLGGLSSKSHIKSWNRKYAASGFYTVPYIRGYSPHSYSVSRRGDFVGYELDAISSFPDEKNQILTLNAWLESEWHDELIRWDPADYGGLVVFRLPSKKLWLPDIVLYNNADDYTSGFMPCNAMVHSDGKVTWSPPARLRSSCKMDITYFPFDIQKCHLKFGSWAYDKAQVDLINRSSMVDVHSYVTNGEWRLTRYGVVRHEVVYPISDAVYPDITVFLVIHRRILYYVLNILFPCFWLNILSVLTFCLPPDAGEKITLSITVLLSYSVFMLLIAESMPPTSDYVPLIEIYLTMSMAVASISVIVSVLVMKLHHCPPHQTKVPQWVKVFILGYLSKIVRCKCFPRRKRKKGTSSFGVTPVKYNEQGEVCTRLIREGRRISRHSHADDNRASGSLNFDYRSVGRSMSNRGSSPDSHVSLYEKTSRGVEELLKYLQMIVAKTEEEDKECELHDEWKQIALVVDRLMFWIFLLITVTFTLVVLVIVPAAKYAKEAT